MFPLVSSDLTAVAQPSYAQSDAWLQTYVPGITYMAQRLAWRWAPSVSVEALISSGLQGMLQALTPSTVTCAIDVPDCIQKAMLAELQAVERLPQAARCYEQTLQEAYTAIALQQGRAATDEEVAAALGLAPSTLADWLMQVRGLSLPDTDPERLAQAIDTLPPLEKIVLALYYDEELTMREIGKVLELSEARASQLHTTALFHVRAALASPSLVGSEAVGSAL
ncbi:MAG: sigma factor-like helix-turn-helix DNA-binding protein [Candidatus Tectimicrobiota bacterium]